MNKAILFSKTDEFSEKAQAVAKTVFGEDLLCASGKVGDPFPDSIKAMGAKTLISFLSPWIIPKYLLQDAEVAVNFHPAPKEYPGIGCYNFALYDGVKEYGAVCHFMAEKVDTGAIIEEARFPIFENDSVETLKLRTMIALLAMFQDIVSKIGAGERLHACGLAWSRKPFTRRDLDRLKVVDATMSKEEVRRRIRATTYPGYPGASVVIGGESFFFPVPGRRPLA